MNAQCSISADVLFSAVLRDLDFNLACLILKACCWSFANEKDLTRIYNVRRSSRRFNAISFLIRSEDLLRIVAACVRTVRFVIRLDTVIWQSVLLVSVFRAVKLFYFVQSWFYFLVVDLLVESCCDDSEEKIVND